MTRAELVNYVARQVRHLVVSDRYAGPEEIRKAVLDLLSELERNPKWGGVAARVPDGGPALKRFFVSVDRRLKEIL